ncbi:MAG: TolC family protein, partial [Alistipes sp.]|nr:TolC family protein [Alistipes sp.]
MKHLFLTAALWAAAATQAQQPRPADAPWTLDECIRHAQQHNIEVQQRALNVEQRDIELSTARYSRLPDLNASVGYNASFGRGTSADNIRRTETLQTGSLDVAASMPLFEGLRINRRIKGSKLDLAAAAEDLERLREDVA